MTLAILVLAVSAFLLYSGFRAEDRRLYGWDISLVAPQSWIVTPAYADGSQRLTRSTNSSDESIIFQSTSTTIFRGAGQPPIGPYTSDRYAMIIADRLSVSSSIPAGTVKKTIGRNTFDFKSNEAEEVGPSDVAGYYYTSNSGRIYRLTLQFSGLSDVGLLEDMLGSIQ